MLHYYWDQLLHYLQKHPLIGFMSSVGGTVLAWKEYIGTILSWAGAVVMIFVGLLTTWSKYLEIKERRLNIEITREKRKQELEDKQQEKKA